MVTGGRKLITVANAAVEVWMVVRFEVEDAAVEVNDDGGDDNEGEDCGWDNEFED